MSYAKKILNKSEKLNIVGQRIWLLESTILIPIRVRSIFQCDCGAIVGWAGSQTDRPKCPKCYPQSVTYKSELKLKTAVPSDGSGVYCDYSQHGKDYILGFCFIHGHFVEYFSCPKKGNSLEKDSEYAAVKLVQNVGIPDEIIYCDHVGTCVKANVNYVKRNLNPAHKAASKKLGFVVQGAGNRLLELYRKHYGEDCNVQRQKESESLEINRG
jgi:hypothetical protein